MANQTPKPDPRERALQKARDILAEHFDHALILVTWEEASVTLCNEAKCGNDYALEGMARAWLDCGFEEIDVETDEEDEEDKRSESWRHSDDDPTAGGKHPA